MKTFFIHLIFLGFCLMLHAQQLVYKPMNPAFGGDTFNYQMLLSSANAQNPFDDSQTDYSSLLDDYNSLDSFTQTLNRQILSQITNQLISDQFGTGSVSPGKYMFGSLYLDIVESSQGLVINILDTSNGDQSQIIIP